MIWDHEIMGAEPIFQTNLCIVIRKADMTKQIEIRTSNFPDFRASDPDYERYALIIKDEKQDLLMPLSDNDLQQLRDAVTIIFKSKESRL
jgi:hypothetical protein